MGGPTAVDWLGVDARRTNAIILFVVSPARIRRYDRANCELRQIVLNVVITADVMRRINVSARNDTNSVVGRKQQFCFIAVFMYTTAQQSHFMLFGISAILQRRKSGNITRGKLCSSFLRIARDMWAILILFRLID